MIFLTIITSVAIALILASNELYNRVIIYMGLNKPFTCPSCLSAWICLVLLLIFYPNQFYVFPVAYLLTSIYMKYESK